MSFFTRESLETLREKIDLVELISTHVPLKRMGASFKACCPFHEEKNPSFVVQRGAEHYHCFGCGAHGDAIAFLMNHLGLGFPEAVQHLAERFQVPLAYDEGEGKEKGPNRAKLKEALEKAALFYHFCLMETEEGSKALAYLFQRGIEKSFIERFTLGYAPRDPDAFRSLMRSQKVAESDLESCGLLLGGHRGSRDFFSQRILFPIREKMGAIIGFSGRKIDESLPGGKYINTPETPLFKKSKVLFGLYESRKRIAKEKQAIVVEGQIDALRLIHEGIDFTVAGQGTAFGVDHVQELTQLGVIRVFLALDGDDAGRAAAVKIGDLFQMKGIEVRIVPLPQGSDPDSFLRERGKEAFLALLEQSVEYLRFAYDQLSSSPSSGGKHRVVGHLAGQIRAWEEPVLVYESLQKLAGIAGIPLQLLGGSVPPPKPRIEQKGSARAFEIDPDMVIEADVLRWLLVVGDQNSKLRTLVKKNLSQHEFRVSACQRLFSLYLEQIEGEKHLDLLSFTIALQEEELRALFVHLSEKKIQTGKAEEGLRSAIGKLLERNWMRKREELQSKITQAVSSDEALLLAAQFDKLKKEVPKVI